jgi:hypothetical protein
MLRPPARLGLRESVLVRSHHRPLISERSIRPPIAHHTRADDSGDSPQSPPSALSMQLRSVVRGARHAGANGRVLSEAHDWLVLDQDQVRHFCYLVAMTRDDIESLQGFVEENLSLLAPVDQAWQPIDYLSDLTAEDAPLGVDVRSVRRLRLRPRLRRLRDLRADGDLRRRSDQGRARRALEPPGPHPRPERPGREGADDLSDVVGHKSCVASLEVERAKQIAGLLR